MVKTSLRVSADSGVVPIATMRHVARWMSAVGFSSGDIQLRQIVSRM
ncbi:hypothetical protein Undi14_09690 [Undibacterium sp. 14-3-2]|nr:hypothetical protein [Undibacterium sp. 14-3-2]MBK1890313.1 hypothetical protein [Undibacterium sp. 14-3-2]